jgi:FkbM family methyltransferase
MTKKKIFRFIKNIIGQDNFKKIKHLIRGGKMEMFDEISLIEHYFIKKKRNSGLMVDVGVNFGQSFLPFAKKGWKVIGFEANPTIAKQIPHHKNFKLYENAVSDSDGQEVTLYASEESEGIGSLLAFTKGHQAAAVVKTITLATVVELEKISSIDFLKIDIEGYDLIALKGFPFDKISPEIIVCEFEDSKTTLLGYDYKDMGNFLLDKGYKVWLSEWHPIVKYGGDHQWLNLRPYYAELVDPKATGNFIAVRPESAEIFDEAIKSYIKKLPAKSA